MSEQIPLIVVVDDDPDWREIQRHRLESAGFCVEGFGDPEEALTFMDTQTPRLIVSDLMMDSLDSGFEFARVVRSRPALAGVPIVIMTAAAAKRGFDLRPKTDEDLRAMNVNAFFDKSENETAFLEAVRRLARTGEGETP